MMGHRHITTTERYLHYTPDPEGGGEAGRVVGRPHGARMAPHERAGRERGPAASRCLKRRAAR